MTAHEMAKKLLEMPDETVFVDVGKDEGVKNIKEVNLCFCQAEIFITLENY